ncbi:TRADD-N-associated membrane domain-containing protein, partial [Streptomyces otsuchiensis]|uniref:TRADD-N-associated membrane domain-containing protein n=1 Tax=Streptomyces otsuchiensis TaxID=2681388 RepID=UPI0013001A89
EALALFGHGGAARETLAEQRQRFFFDFLKHSLQQAEWTFRLSVWFMSGGAAILLAGGVLALVHAGDRNLSYIPVVTSLTGTLITVGGGAMAVQARRARSHVTEQADRMDAKIDLDHKLEMAITLIDRVNDPSARDRLHAAAALKALDMQSSPDVMVDRLLPGRENRSRREIERDDSWGRDS